MGEKGVHMVKVRVGVPLTGGKLVKAARDEGFPVLFSANAFAKTYAKGHEREGFFRKFALPDIEQFEGLDAALDSAGFVAAVKYGDYRWGIQDYVDLAQSFNWSWWASMDYCVEPQVSKDRPLRILRIAATSRLLGELNVEAESRGMKLPMPVLQGWDAREYLMCADWLPLQAWPDLVGIGSVCRRHLNGPDGILAIVDELDRYLPAHVKFHLFGVKSTALEPLVGHHRIASMDSMAWDFGARMERRTGRDMEFRISKMREWAHGQMSIVERGMLERGLTSDVGRSPTPAADAQASLFPPEDFGGGFSSDDELFLEALALYYARHLMEGNLGYLDAVWEAKSDAAWMLHLVRSDGLNGAIKEIGDERDGLAEIVEELLVERGVASRAVVRSVVAA